MIAPSESRSLPLITTRGPSSDGGASRSETLKPVRSISCTPSFSASMLASMICWSLSRPRVKRSRMKSSKYSGGIPPSAATAPITTMLAARGLPVERASSSTAMPTALPFDSSSKSSAL